MGTFEEIDDLVQSIPVCERADDDTKPHVNARSKHPQYPDRFHVPDRYSPRKIVWDDYDPVEFTHGAVIANDSTKKKGGWADPMDFSMIDFKTRSANFTRYQLGSDQRPINPKGRTGMIGRGLLGKWGPNFAADPIVTRMTYIGTKLRVQMVVIKRRDTGEWAIPGGMVDDGELVSVTLRREFQEEATSFDEETSRKLQIKLDELFDESNALKVYQGYVDDPRNTDNAWMETSVCLFHCSKSLGQDLKLNAGDDACQVKWLTIEKGNEDFEALYANHKVFVLMAVQLLLKRFQNAKSYLLNYVQPVLSPMVRELIINRPDDAEVTDWMCKYLDNQ